MTSESAHHFAIRSASSVLYSPHDSWGSTISTGVSPALWPSSVAKERETKRQRRKKERGTRDLHLPFEVHGLGV